MKTGNPVLNEKVFTQEAGTAVAQEPMTLGGTVGKSFALTGLLVLAAGYVWHLAVVSGPTAVGPFIAIGAIGGFIVALITIFNKPISAYTSPVYAVLEGACLGGISVLTNTQYPGI